MEASGPSADIVLSSRVRLARNLRDFPFPPRLDAEGSREVVAAVAAALTALNRSRERHFELYRLADISALDRQVLVEKHLISPLLAKNEGGAVILSDDEAVSIMVNEEDHLRIQCLVPGLQLERAWEIADAVDNVLNEVLPFAFSERQGFLTTCPTNLGTGMRASVMMHLPGLVLSEQAGRVLDALAKVGVVVRGIYGEGTQAKGNLFQVSNQVTLGQTEQEIVENLQSVARQLIERERSAREMLYRQWRDHLEDRVCRAYGILMNARVITSEEALKLLSDMRLGIDQKILPHVSPQVFNDLIVATRSGFLQKLAGQELSPAERDRRRAALIRQRLQKAQVS
ncbi:MAG TPA: protein arginine kinase [Bacillota bacterium]